MHSFWIILIGSFVAISCGLLGCFLILRKMAMVGDAISHAVLPGIVIAFIISESRDSFMMLIGAVSIGIFTTFLIEFLHRKGKLQTDASIGVTFTWLFAIGVILVSYTREAHIDEECVLFGEITYVSTDLWITDAGTNLGPRFVYITGVTLLLNLLFIIFGYKELKATTFDAAFAGIMGISATLWHYLLMGFVSMTTVASFESVGAILVIALLIAPPATAYLLTTNLKRMLILTSIIGVIVAVTGYYLAVLVNGSIAGAMSTMAGVLFALAFLFSPQEGILIKKRKIEQKTVNA
ncbi:MAG: metal ABC transporter permease [Bacteroidota bacterium]